MSYRNLVPNRPQHQRAILKQRFLPWWVQSFDLFDFCHSWSIVSHNFCNRHLRLLVSRHRIYRQHSHLQYQASRPIGTNLHRVHPSVRCHPINRVVPGHRLNQLQSRIELGNLQFEHRLPITWLVPLRLQHPALQMIMKNSVIPQPTVLQMLHRKPLRNVLDQAKTNQNN